VFHPVQVWYLKEEIDVRPVSLLNEPRGHSTHDVDPVEFP
jgi:hypothetical protein